MYRPKAETDLHTDATKLGLGGILMQTGKDGGKEWRPVAYFSRYTTAAEQMYHSNELETLAVMELIRRFRVYFIGVLRR